MKFIDKFLNSITMYRLLLYGLTALAFFSMVFGFLGFVGYSALEVFVSLVVLIIACYVSNFTFAKIWKVPRNVESEYITAFILLFVLAPSLVTVDLLWIAFAGVVAMASKYIFAINKKHIWNPAAFGATVVAILGTGLQIWWVATPWMLLPVAILGFLILRKIKRFQLFFTFAATSIIIVFISKFVAIPTNISDVTSLVLSYPLLFLGCIMLTEPLTTPPTKGLRIIYGIIVGFLFSVQFHFGPIYSAPALALILANISSYIVSPKGRFKLSFVSRRQVAVNFYEFTFSPDKKIDFIPGQYLEWTLAHSPSDSRGNRRYFTIASAPGEEYMHLGVRIDPEHSSTFKKKLLSLKVGDSLMVGALSGEFVMPKDKQRKLVLIAGGVGVTPFRSMIQSLQRSGEKRDIILIYSCMTPLDIAFQDEFEKAESNGVKVIYIVTKPDGGWTGRVGYISKQMIEADIPDYVERDFYLSGPNVMVENYEKLLTDMTVPWKNIHTDYFPGY